MDDEWLNACAGIADGIENPKILNDEEPNYYEMLSKEQKDVFHTIFDKRENVFTTGPGGVGKSFLLKAVVKEFEKRDQLVGVSATTGIAAAQIGGSTIHSIARIGRGEGDLKDLLKKVKKDKKAKSYWSKLDALIIDEISMLSGDLFEKLDRVIQYLRSNVSPFGGIQLIIFGDFYQLPPVEAKYVDGKRTERKFCFETKTWANTINSIHVLTKSFRQKDPAFFELLSRIRVQKHTRDDLAVLRGRIGVTLDTGDVKPTKLYSRNDQVDEMNRKELMKIPSKEYVYIAKKEIRSELNPGLKKKLLEDLGKRFIVEETLTLKKGAQVMLLKNLDVEEELANGSRGIIVNFKTLYENSTTLYPVVQFTNGKSRLIIPTVWSTEGDFKDWVGTVSQVPLKLAWAHTIHKAQGLTIDAVEIDLSNIFDPGQGYVALSRCKSLENTKIINMNDRCFTAHQTVLKYYEAIESKSIVFPKKGPTVGEMFESGAKRRLEEAKQKESPFKKPRSIIVIS